MSSLFNFGGKKSTFRLFLAKIPPFLNNKLLAFFNFFQIVSIFDAINHFWSFKPLGIILGTKGDKQIKKS